MIKLTHYAFREGRTGHANGCQIDRNPYRAPDGTVPAHQRTAYEQWAAGWTAQDRGVTLKQEPSGVWVLRNAHGIVQARYAEQDGELAAASLANLK